MRILLVDDHAVVRRGIRQILADDLSAAEFGEADGTNEALRRVGEADWDIVILDISMPGRGGLDALKDIRGLRPRLPILVLSMHSEDQYAFRAGASGYLTKESPPAALVEAVRRVASGGCHMSAAVADKLAADRPTDDSRPLHESLSDREFQVLRMIAAGKTVKEIGFELHLSEKTISTYRTRVLEKMKMRSNAELTRYAVSAGLVE
ncbi:MAG: response regulator transcription factor [Deltaproteobacteria bacterium]|nr:response regulator transcription factor [Deltaproteobacteria bacterium]